MVKKKTQPKKPEVTKKVAIPKAIVGIGASAGGLEAITELLEHVPEKTGMAFIYVQHLDKTHKSLLTPILSRVTSLPVEEARHGTRVHADHFYISPAGKNISIKDGVLHLSIRARSRGHSVVIDDFFRSLAVDQKNKSIGIILSGTASDGVLGLEAIKDEGGITFAQDEESAKYPDMPHNAVDSGAVDHVLTPSSIAEELVRISRHAGSISAPSISIESYEKNDQQSLQKIHTKKVSARRSHFNPLPNKDLNLSRAQVSRDQDVQLKIENLEREVARIKEHFQPGVKESKNISPETFSSENAEILSFNEELQSTNEELETTKEELLVRNAEMSQINDDFTNVLHATNVPIIIVDRELNIRRFTPFAEKSLRILPSDVGRPITDIRLPIRFPDLGALLLEVIQTAQARHEETEDEAGRWYTLWVRPYMSLNNKIDGAVITFIDIDEIKHAQIELEQSLSYVQNILGTMREPLIVLDKDFKIKSANTAFYKMFLLTPEDTEGMLLYDLKNHAWDTPKLHEALEKILPEKSSFQNLEIDFHFPTMGTKFMSLNGQRLLPAVRREELILLAMQDLTERILLQQRNESFISTASHELKTPVTTIKTLIQILQKRFEESEDKMLVEYLVRMDDQIVQLTKLVVDLLDVSKIKANKFEMEEKTFDFDMLAHEIVKSCQLLSPKHIILIQGETKAMIRGDRGSISRVFINLIVNAIKYSPREDKIIITLSHTSKEVCVDVQDFGIGIAKIYQDKIFERFFQIGNESGQNFSGLGIGLYISGSIVAQHGGHISVVSQKGVGSTFSFWIPIQKMK